MAHHGAGGKSISNTEDVGHWNGVHKRQGVRGAQQFHAAVTGDNLRSCDEVMGTASRKMPSCPFFLHSLSLPESLHEHPPSLSHFFNPLSLPPSSCPSSCISLPLSIPPPRIHPSLLSHHTLLPSHPLTQSHLMYLRSLLNTSVSRQNLMERQLAGQKANLQGGKAKLPTHTWIM